MSDRVLFTIPTTNVIQIPKLKASNGLNHICVLVKTFTILIQQQNEKCAYSCGLNPSKTFQKTGYFHRLLNLVQFQCPTFFINKICSKIFQFLPYCSIYNVLHLVSLLIQTKLFHPVSKKCFFYPYQFIATMFLL